MIQLSVRKERPENIKDDVPLFFVVTAGIMVAN